MNKDMFVCPLATGLKGQTGLNLYCLSTIKGRSEHLLFAVFKSGPNTATNAENPISPSQNSSSRFPNPVLYSLHFLEKSVSPFWRR